VHLPGVEQRFWDKVEKTDDCWHWTGSKTKGYGNFVLNGGHVYSHVLAWEWSNGPVPVGYRLARQQTCPRHCIRPEHWSPKTPLEINRDARTRRKQCHSSTKHERPESVRSPANQVPSRSPQHWKTRWQQKPASC
jgi:hypothetical protein